MKIFSLKKTLYALGFVLIINGFIACDSTDKYIDWKVLNDEWYEAHKNDEGFTRTKSGLCYRRIGEPANPAERQPNMTDNVWINYEGSYIDGIVFDSDDTAGGKPMSLSGVVSGFQEGILKMREGETFQFYIPQNIGYGSDGSYSIPPYSTLIFTVTLVDSRAL